MCPCYFITPSVSRNGVSLFLSCLPDSSSSTLSLHLYVCVSACLSVCLSVSTVCLFSLYYNFFFKPCVTSKSVYYSMFLSKCVSLFLLFLSHQRFINSLVVLCVGQNNCVSISMILFLLFLFAL